MMKPKVYIETSVVSYLTGRPSRDVELFAYQQSVHADENPADCGI